MASVSGFDPDEDYVSEYDSDRPAARVTCRHCFVWSEVRSGEMAVVCGHGCGQVMHSWISTDINTERRLAEESQANFRHAHVNGCPARKRRQDSYRSSSGRSRTSRRRRGF